MPTRVAVIIPALDEEESLPLVLRALARVDLGQAREGAPIALSRVVVVDNGSADATARVAAECGATVVSEPRRGYGRACLAGLARLAQEPPDIVAFLDADFSDDPSLLPSLVRPIADGSHDFVLGSRLLGRREPGALPPHSRAGNRVAVGLIRLLFGHHYTDLGPFRALRYASLASLRMRDGDFGWTAEMQVKAVVAGLRIAEVPAPYRRRVGVSKITGTLSGSLKAAAKICWTIARLRVAPGVRPGPARSAS